MSLQKGKLDRLVEDTEQAFNELSRMHDRLTSSFLIQTGDTERHTRQVIETLQKAEDARRKRGAARIRIADLLVELERDPGIGASDEAVGRNLMERLLEDEERSWILLRDEIRSLSQKTSSAEAARVIAEIRTLVDGAFGL